MTEPRGQELVQRYKAHYSISPSSAITEEEILRHWELERALRDKLLASAPDNRWDVFEACYTQLYRELDWLNPFVHSGVQEAPGVAYGHWVPLIGAPPRKVYEIGSGKGDLISYLASRGFECKATEITRERGARWAPAHPNLTWGVSDGIHLERFEPAGIYDVAISNYVIEHMHPDDLLDHLAGVYTILTDGGRYILSTPHASVGPTDVSSVFRRDTPIGMHLKEYTYGEIKHLLERAGFKTVYAPLRFPKSIRRLSGRYLKTKNSRSYLAYLCAVEKLIAVLPTQTVRRKVAQVFKLVLFATNLMVVAEKDEGTA